MRAMEIALCYNGLLVLCLAIPKHYRQLCKDMPADTTRWVLRILGWLAVAGAFFVAVGQNGWSLGPVEWIGTLGIVGLMLIFLWPFKPSGAALLGGLFLILAVINAAS